MNIITSLIKIAEILDNAGHSRDAVALDKICGSLAKRAFHEDDVSDRELKGLVAEKVEEIMENFLGFAKRNPEAIKSALVLYRDVIRKEFRDFLEEHNTVDTPRSRQAFADYWSIENPNTWDGFQEWLRTLTDREMLDALDIHVQDVIQEARESGAFEKDWQTEIPMRGSI